MRGRNILAFLKKGYGKLRQLLGRALPAALWGGLFWLIVLCMGHFFGEGSRAMARAVTGAIAFCTEKIPIPLSEVFLALAVVLVLWFLLGGAIRGKGRGFLRGLCRTVALALWVGGVFTFLWGVQYQAPSLAEELGLSVRPRSVDELMESAMILLEQANELADQVPRDEDGTFLSGDFSSLSQETGAQYEKLGESYSVYGSGRVTMAKQARVLGKLMPWVGIAGYYFPFTAEPTVGPTVSTHLAYNIAHEQAHCLGVAPEDEAGFSAYLACVNSDDPGVRYSGVINGYIYLSNALYDVSPELSSLLSSQVGENLRRDIRALNDYLSQFEGPAKTAGTAVNDAYLKAQNQTAGIQSYGNMAELLIAYTLDGLE